MRAAVTTVGLMFVLTLGSATALLAQDEPIAPSQLVSAPAAEYQPLSLGKKYSDSLTQIFGFPQLAVITVRTTIDQRRDRPVAWGTGPEGFAHRFAARFGKGLVHENVAFGVRALDHEDPRYFPAAHGRFLKRLGYAATGTVRVRKDDGTMMPAYSRFISDYATPFAERHWRPEPFTARMGLKAGTISLGIGALVNVGQEFWPDAKRKLARRFHREP